MDRITYSVMTRLAPYPSLAVPLDRLRGEGEPVDSRIDLVVETYPRYASPLGGFCAYFAPPKLRGRAERPYSWLARTGDVGPS